MKNFNMVISPLYFISIFFSISSTSWLTIWIGMEMNLLVFIFIILEDMSPSSSESSMKYFMVQAIGSLIFLFSIISNSIYYNEMFYINALVPPMALMLKSGMAPLHTWTPNIVMNFNYKSLSLFLTFQKIVPLIILFSSWSYLIKIIIMFNIIIGSMSGISQSSFNKMMVFSSINNSGWMLMTLMESLFMFFLFFIFYLLMTLMVIKFSDENKIKWLIQIKSLLFFKKINYFSLMMSLSGLPPFMGFLPKWLVLKKMSEISLSITCISLVFSIFTMYFYLKSSICMIFSSFMYKKWSIQYNQKLILPFLLNLSICPLFFILT